MVNKKVVNLPKNECKTIGICAGCFTILTPNHVRYLEEARSQCDYLIVLTNFDSYIENKKGVVPISCEDRLVILKGLSSVNESSAFDGPNEEEWIKRFMRIRMHEFHPDAKVVLFHDEPAMLGVRPDKIVGFEIVDKLVMIGRKPGTSVSDVFRKIRSSATHATST